MSSETVAPNSGELLPQDPGVISDADLWKLLGSSAGLEQLVEPIDEQPTPNGSEWYGQVTPDRIPDFPPAHYVLPSEITGENPSNTFKAIALPLLRELFPAHYSGEVERVTRAQQKNPELEVEITPEAMFTSEALRLRIILDAADEAAKDGDDVLMTFDNDKTMSRKTDTSLHLGALATHDGEWAALSDSEQRSAYHQMVMSDVDATVISPAVIVAVNVLKHKYGKRITFGMITSNVQEYLDLFCTKLNALTGDAFDPNYMIGYNDGRFADDMMQERRMTRGDKNADPKLSPRLEDLFSFAVSPLYADAGRYLDFAHPDAVSISAQDLKPGIILRVKDEDPYRRLSVVHIDDMPSAMRHDVPGARYVQLPEEAWFKLVENGLF